MWSDTKRSCSRSLIRTTSGADIPVPHVGKSHPVAAQESRPDMKPEDGAPVVPGPAPATAMGAQPIPQTGLRSCADGVRSYAHDPRDASACGARLTGFEEEVDASLWPS